jgi:hypothetical protein
MIGSAVVQYKLLKYRRYIIVFLINEPFILLDVFIEILCRFIQINYFDLLSNPVRA